MSLTAEALPGIEFSAVQAVVAAMIRHRIVSGYELWLDFSVSFFWVYINIAFTRFKNVDVQILGIR